MKAFLTKTFVFDAAHRLPDHPGKCQFLHGHTYTVDVTVYGEVSPQTGMVIDFSNLKDIVGRVLALVDHRTILWQHDPFLPALSQVDGLGPNLVTLPVVPTAENLARYFYREISAHFTALAYDEVSLYSIEIAEGDGGHAKIQRAI